MSSLSTGGSASSSDALVWALFVATLLHGLIILGITFDDSSPARSSSQPLKVVLSDPQAEELDYTPDDAVYAAAANRLGSGTERAQDSGGIVMPANAMDALGETDGDADQEQEQAAEQVPQDQLVTPNEAQREINAPPEAAPQPAPARLSARIQFASPTTTFQRRDRLQAEGEIRELEISVSTQASDVAEYMAQWKDRVEEVGTLYFPDAARQQGLSGSPLVEVAISADGGLRSIQVVRPSDHPLLDQAALRILRLAAPFAPFPEHLRRDYDSLRFVYEWRFAGGRIISP
ncbi:MAG: energy transducer TonB [Pseudomonadota bacterium]